MDKLFCKEETPSQSYDLFSADYIHTLLSLIQPVPENFNYQSAELFQSTTVPRSCKGFVKFAEYISPTVSAPNAVYFTYSFNVYPQYMERIDNGGAMWPQLADVEAELKSGFSEIDRKTEAFTTSRHLPCFPPAQFVNSSREIRWVMGSKGERRNDVGTVDNPKDHWELNRRRPSVIRRSLSSSDDLSCSREAVLTVNSTLESFDESGEESKTIEFREKLSSTGDKPIEALQVDCTRSESREDEKSSGKRRRFAFIDLTKEQSARKRRFMVDEVVSTRRKKLKFCCFYCKRRFQWFSHWQAHERAHTRKKRSNGLQRYIFTHPKNEYECSFCSERFPEKSLLQRHVLDHPGIKRLDCMYCDEQFSDAEALEAE